METARRIRNLGILAHVDAGKTTVTEHMLFLSGGIRTLGNVDKGTSLSDALDIERRRGISVRASTISFEWQDVQINLIDTPGHVDFAAEVERSLRVLDSAVLVLSAVEGIQTQTEALWHALGGLNIPLILFLNKIDRVGADTASVIQALRSEFSPDVVQLNRAVGEGDADTTITDLDPEQRNDLVERVSEKDDALLARYLNDEAISQEDLQPILSASVGRRDLYPVLCGSSKYNRGIRELLDGIVSCLPDAATDSGGPVSGVVYRLDHDPKLGRLAGVRMYSGRLRARDTVLNATAEREEKITQIKRISLNRREDAEMLGAGEVGILCGLPEVRIGDVLGNPDLVPGGYALVEPLLTVQVKPQDEADYARLAEVLQQLTSEDPHLDFEWFQDERELHVKIMGPVQIEILTEVLKARFGIDAHFSDPTVIYKETPGQAGEVTERYTMPKPCWGVVTFLLEPTERGSGVSYRSEVGVNGIKRKYQHEIEACIPDALKQGIKGWEITDLEITLIGGEDHVLHSRPGNFKLATNIAFMKGLAQTDTILLEPILAFRLSAPESFMGKITADIIHMRGTFDPPEMGQGTFLLTGRVPLATSMDYAIRLGSLTGGRAKLSVTLEGYDTCPEGQGEVREYKGISPLDRSKYILKMRGAITQSPTS